MLTPQSRIYKFSGYTLDLNRGCLREADREIRLRPKTFEVLTYFVSHAGRLLSKDELMDAVWAGITVTEDSLVQCVKEIRRAIGDSAQESIKTIPGRGYIFDLAVSTSAPTPQDETTIAAPTKAAPDPNPAWPRLIRAIDWRLVAAGIGVLVLLSGIGWWLRASAPLEGSTTAAAPTRLSIVVLPFANLSGDPTQDYFADGVTDNLTTDLSTHISGLFVIARNTAFTFKGKNVDVQQLGRDLGVHYVLEGSVQRSEDQVRVNAQLIDAQSGAHLWAERFQEERRELFALEDRITGRIANTLGIQLVQAAARGTDASKSEPNAADLVMQGRALMSLPESRENVDQAATLFRQAIAADDRSVEANVGLATALTAVLLNFYGELGPERDDLLRGANEAADRALTLDPGAPSAHEIKGEILRSEHKNLESTHEFEITIAHDPNSASAYDNLGAAMYRLGQPEKAIPLIEKALRLSPRDNALSIFEWHLGTAYMFLHDYDRATEHFLKARAANPQFQWLFFHLAGAYALKGDDETARAYLADALKWRPKATMKGMRAVRESDNPEYLRMREETLITGLRRAGLPEQ